MNLYRKTGEKVQATPVHRFILVDEYVPVSVDDLPPKVVHAVAEELAKWGVNYENVAAATFGVLRAALGETE